MRRVGAKTRAEDSNILPARQAAERAQQPIERAAPSGLVPRHAPRRRLAKRCSVCKMAWADVRGHAWAACASKAKVVPPIENEAAEKQPVSGAVCLYRF